MTELPHLPDWFLDERLAADSVTIGDLALSRLLLMRDANYPWLILVPRVANAVEIIDLETAGQAALMVEIAQVSQVLRSLTDCHKLNVAALGNMVPQLHVHVIARFREDAAWPGPVWGKVPPRAYEPDAIHGFVAAIGNALVLRQS